MNNHQSNPDQPAHKARFIDYLKAWPLYLLPHHLVSSIVFKATRSRRLKKILIPWFIKQFKVDLAQSKVKQPLEFEHFNAFFTRELEPGARPLTDAANSVASPVDGAVSALGDVEDGRIFQAKGHSYSLLELLGGEKSHTEYFNRGKFATLYLSPRDYHRIHMPIAGTLIAQTYVPGRLFSVAPHTVKNYTAIVRP